MKTTAARIGSALALVMAAATGALAQPGQLAPAAADDLELPPVTVAPQGPADGATIVATPAQGEPAPGQMVVVVAPHNENWSNVSHINGQLVPVGQRVDYIMKDKEWNISTNPIGYLFGLFGVSVAKSMNHNVALRGDVNIFNIDGDSGYEVGISAPIYLKRVFSGPFLEPGLIARDFDTNNGEGALVGPEVLFGWHWTFDSGLNVSAAVGAAKNVQSRHESCDAYGYCYTSGPDLEPAGYFRVGYAF